MKKVVLGTAIIAASFAACTNNGSQQTNTTESNTTPSNKQATTQSGNQSVSLNELLTPYLNLKNALANDNGKEAADVAKQFSEAIAKIDETSFSPDQKIVYDDVKEDAKEHAEHISTNASNIEHQREHFETLSDDMYDLVKAVKPSQNLYLVHCPMYNNKKGANWLSEVKEIHNPYLGKKMPECGIIKEEIK
jgi:uncharacterized protein (DUF885 family)